MAGLRIVDGRVKTPESEVLGFKSCRGKLSKDFWPTYSAFANTFGGTVVMGVDDQTRELTGVDDADKVIKELWDLLNDDKMVSTNLLTSKDVEVVVVDGRQLIRVRIPRAERRKRPVYVNGSMENGTYRRSGEGDYHCSVEELKQMLRDASDSPQDSLPAEGAGTEDLDPVSVRSFRERMSSRNPAHPWVGLDDQTFLKRVGACVSSADGTVHPTVAGLLMFGYDYSILSEFPNYHLDYLEFSDDSENWSFRISTGTGEFTGNVYSFVTQVANRITVTSPRGKVIEGMTRTDDTSMMRAQRELLVNALVHADYRGLRGVRVEKRGSTFSVRNPGNLRIPLGEMLEGGVSDPRNPRLALMMGLIGLCERAGSGVCDVVAICRGLRVPEPEYVETSDPDTVTVKMRLNSDYSEDLDRVILGLMRGNPGISIDKISDQTGVDRNKVARTIDSMKSDGRVTRVGGTRGKWVVS